jgi:N utilization substance protein B
MHGQMGQRRMARELALQVLFQMEYQLCAAEQGFQLVLDNFSASHSARPYAERLVKGITGAREEIDQWIRPSSKHWRLERMPHVDRNILRLAVYELLCVKEVPAKVSMDEAIDIAKQYGSEGSGSFVNGVLDDIYNRMREEGIVE